MRHYIPQFSAVIAPLENRKTFLLWGLRGKGLVQGVKRKVAAAKEALKCPTPKELAAFHQLQRFFSRVTMLDHFDKGRQLYIDTDTSKLGIGATVYHLKDGAKLSTVGYPKQKDVEPILFLNRWLSDPETRYWPTELERMGNLACRLDFPAHFDFHPVISIHLHLSPSTSKRDTLVLTTSAASAAINVAEATAPNT